ncbi:MAG TPA: response regulator [Methylomirabilota bacterium]|jgi:DNA-binding NtrC family response regulator|nr:response regulator [Methylomirabilota bacterium]
MQRILVADDDMAALDGLRALLATWGYEVETAADGRQALERASVIRPAAVITDIVMPAMDGLELLTALRHDQPGVPVIVVTGLGNVDTQHRAAQKGAYGYLSKPIDAGRLKTLLKDALEARDSGARRGGETRTT